LLRVVAATLREPPRIGVDGAAVVDAVTVLGEPGKAGTLPAEPRWLVLVALRGGRQPVNAGWITTGGGEGEGGGEGGAGGDTACTSTEPMSHPFIDGRG
jgi:hypothetical protein